MSVTTPCFLGSFPLLPVVRLPFHDWTPLCFVANSVRPGRHLLLSGSPYTCPKLFWFYNSELPIPGSQVLSWPQGQSLLNAGKKSLGKVDETYTLCPVPGAPGEGRQPPGKVVLQGAGGAQRALERAGPPECFGEPPPCGPGGQLRGFTVPYFPYPFLWTLLKPLCRHLGPCQVSISPPFFSAVVFQPRFLIVSNESD